MNKPWVHIIGPIIILYILLLLRPGILGPFASPIIVILSAIYLCYYLLSNPSLVVVSPSISKSNKSIWIAFGFLSLITIIWADTLYQANPIDIAKSDILPLLKEIYYTRFINGEFVYAHVDGYDYISWTPNYLPMHWLPFVPAFYFGFDPRWMALGILLLSIGIYIYQLQKQENSKLDLWIKTLMPFAFIITIFIKQKVNSAHNVEFLICGYYMLLSIGIQLASKSLTAMGFINTILSRYMSVFYVPIDVYLSIKNKNKQSLLIYSSVLFGILLLYIIPFVFKDPLLFFKGASAYDVAALGEWKGQSWQVAGDKPFQLFQGFGFANWFYSLSASDLQTRIHFLKLTLFSIMVLAMVGLILLSNKFQHTNSYKVVSLFLLVLLFTSFALVPYNYLFWNCLFMIPVLILPYRIVRWRNS